MSSQTGKHFESLPGWAKGIVAIAVVGTAITATIILYKKASKIGSKKDYKDTIRDTNQELVDLSKKEKQSYPDSTYSAWANSIFTLLSGCDAHTNEAKVGLIILNVKNETDWLKLIKAFGVREIEGCWSSNYTADLPTTLKKEMYEMSITQFNDFFSKRRIKSRI